MSVVLDLEPQVGRVGDVETLNNDRNGNDGDRRNRKRNGISNIHDNKLQRFLAPSQPIWLGEQPVSMSDDEEKSDLA